MKNLDPAPGLMATYDGKVIRVFIPIEPALWDILAQFARRFGFPSRSDAAPA